MQTMQERIVVGLDIGTTKVCAVVAAPDEMGRVNILGLGEAPSEGLNRGVVVNIDKTVQAIRKAVNDAAHAAGVQVESVVVGIAGDHIQSFQSRGVVTISNKNGIISPKDVARLLEDTTHVALPADRRILHVVPQEFIVDGQDGVLDPVGMSGVRLEANVHIISGLVTAARNIFTCVERAGYQVADIVLEPLASAHAVLYPEEKEIGVVLVDIGGGTTDVAIFEDNTIRHTAVIGVAGNKVTDDVRKGLGVMREHAEQLKRQFGQAIAEFIDEEVEIVIPGIGEYTEKRIRQSTLAQIIQPRLEEILEFVQIEIKRSGHGRHMAGIVLTGGGSQIPGTAELAMEVLGMNTARIGRPVGLGGGLVDEVQNPKYATAVGLTLYGLKPETIGGVAFSSRGLEATEENDGQEESQTQKIWDRMKLWFREF